MLPEYEYLKHQDGTQVLILVLVEYAPWAKNENKYIHTVVEVLILVLVEYAPWDKDGTQKYFGVSS